MGNIEIENTWWSRWGKFPGKPAADLLLGHSVGKLAKRDPTGTTSKTDLELILLFKNTEQCPSNPCPLWNLDLKTSTLIPRKIGRWCSNPWNWYSSSKDLRSVGHLFALLHSLRSRCGDLGTFQCSCFGLRMALEKEWKRSVDVSWLDSRELRPGEKHCFKEENLKTFDLQA